MTTKNTRHRASSETNLRGIVREPSASLIARPRCTLKANSMADVIIIGSGPAGSCAAIRCARWGLDVVLLERELFPRDRLGESLHPGFETLLEQLGVLDAVLAAGFLRFDGNWVEWKGTTSFEA